jgi:hypothetical protein
MPLPAGRKPGDVRLHTPAGSLLFRLRHQIPQRTRLREPRCRMRPTCQRNRSGALSGRVVRPAQRPETTPPIVICRYWATVL